jgi:hypothetical protein
MSKSLRRIISAIAYASAVAATSSQAVVLSESGIGQVLLFPYYSVRGGTGVSAFNTLVSVVNTANDTKAIRLRFREGKNGREVANYNIFLAPLDTWTVALFPSDTGTSAITHDNSCLASSPTSTGGLLQFTNADYSGSRGDGEDTSPDRTREGFFEAIEMATITDPTLAAFIATKVCLPATLSPSTLGPPTGGLMGGASLVNVGAGTLYSYDPTVLDGFSATSLYAPVDQGGPTLESVNPKIAAVHESTGVRITHWDGAQGARPADPVSAVLMRDSVVNGFVLDTATASRTSWVVTMPTKVFYGAPGTPPATPFQSQFGDGFGVYPNPSCSRTSPRTRLFDREGGFEEPCFQLPPSSPPVVLPWSATVINFARVGSSTPLPNLLASVNTFGFPQAFSQNGWGVLIPEQVPSRPLVHKLVSTDTPPRTYYGLPMIGFMANDFRNNTLSVPGVGNVLSNYGEASPHRGVVRAE